MELTLPDLREGYKTACEFVRDHGQDVHVRGMGTAEITGMTLEFPDVFGPMLPIQMNRKINTKLAAIESLCLLGGTWRHDLITAAAPQYTDVLVSDAPDDATYAAYGPRIRTQLLQVMAQLKKDKYTRQAILQIWAPRDLAHRGDKPCTLSMQFLIRKNKLELHVTMRSQDVWYGLGMDVFIFTQLQLTIAEQLRIDPGKYVHHIGSFHLYDRDAHKVQLLDVQPLSHNTLPLGLIAVSNPPVLARTILNGGYSDDNIWYSDAVHSVFEKVHV